MGRSTYVNVMNILDIDKVVGQRNIQKHTFKPFTKINYQQTDEDAVVNSKCA